MGRLNILPDVYYDLTGPETAALMAGAEDREIFQLRNTRIVATLLRNAHFSKPVSETEFMPLPGDENTTVRGSSPAEQEALFQMFQNAFGGEITIEDK